MKRKYFFFAPSTLDFIKEARRTPGFGFFDWLHSYVYARWTYLYIALGTGRHPLMRAYGRMLKHLRPRRPSATRAARTAPAKGTWAEGYHGKVLPLAAAKQLVMINEPIRLENLEKILPYQRAKDIILQNPDHLIALECPCRASRPDPCLPLDVCLIVGEPFASFVHEHHANRSRWISSDEAVEILQAEDRRGHVHHAFFKDAMLGRFYAICNCCACCCGAIRAHQHGTPMLASSGYLAQVDSDACIACGDCAETCQFGALAVGDLYMEVDRAKCMGCGVCLSHCSQNALSLERAPEKGEPLEILELMKL